MNNTRSTIKRSAAAVALLGALVALPGCDVLSSAPDITDEQAKGAFVTAIETRRFFGSHPKVLSATMENIRCAAPSADHRERLDRTTRPRILPATVDVHGYQICSFTAEALLEFPAKNDVKARKSPMHRKDYRDELFVLVTTQGEKKWRFFPD